MTDGGPRKQRIAEATDYGRYAGLGFQFAATMLLFGALGWWLDERWGRRCLPRRDRSLPGPPAGRREREAEATPAGRPGIRRRRSPPTRMTSNHHGALLAIALAAPVAWRLGGAHAGGIVAGVLLGGGLTLGFAAWQRHLITRAPRRVMQAVAAGLLCKLFALLAGVLLLRFVEPLGARCDWQSFLVAFAAAAVLVLLPRTVETMRLPKASRAL
jgi:hypothetical protein